MNAKLLSAIAITALLFFADCVSSPAIGGLTGLDHALDAAIAEIEAKLPKGTAVVAAAISAPDRDTGLFISDELSGRFNSLVTLAREVALQAVESEQQFQMTGLVSDASAVGIGHYLGAQAVVSGELRPYAGFTQFRLRVVDVKRLRKLSSIRRG